MEFLAKERLIRDLSRESIPLRRKVVPSFSISSFATKPGQPTRRANSLRGPLFESRNISDRRQLSGRQNRFPLFPLGLPHGWLLTCFHDPRSARRGGIYNDGSFTCSEPEAICSPSYFAFEWRREVGPILRFNFITRKMTKYYLNVDKCFL